MNHILARRAGAVAAALALCLVGAPAQAATPPGVASAGSADFTRAGRHVVVPALAPCSVGGPTTASSSAVAEAGIRFGAGSSTCTTTVIDAQNNTTETRSSAQGVDFELSALTTAGGARLKVGRWQVSCTGREDGTAAGWELEGLSGFPGLPKDIPANYRYEVKGSTGVVLAEITFSEVLLPEPNDGSLTMNLMHLRFAEASGATGDVVVGAASCSPTP
ncbi:hypothetical protein ABZ816_29300 [Actinosynnema sp. NPDC047251]|uniref:Secreted protein n=1 Tax=Saccharothrix espanaensis (strain ATCC 51144 / DSM 44229 / JCM 9112 / NBRC 15066 / NRRL 15764) TaxID=1179773 RepID=K0JUJ8_SACES|nr:hypothetical protein [Saccharothrix espanaensis]CCH28484.1 hypothetical protein BN6_11580 [Saccharothrix espanaensis DSM 44229]